MPLCSINQNSLSDAQGAEKHAGAGVAAPGLDELGQVQSQGGGVENGEANLD